MSTSERWIGRVEGYRCYITVDKYKITYANTPSQQVWNS